jgi:hypothetical protein
MTKKENEKRYRVSRKYYASGMAFPWRASMLSSGNSAARKRA